MKPRTVSLALALIASLAGRSVLAQPPPRDHQTPLDEALKAYQECTGKTVLRSPNLPSITEFNQPIPSSDTNGVRMVLENDLLNKGIEMIPLGEDIVMAVESGWKNSPTPNYIATVKRRPAQVLVSTSNVSASNHEKPVEESIPPGTIDFQGASINQFLDLYGLLLNRSLLRSSQISSSTFKLHTQTPFTKSAIIYLLEVSLALNGIASVDDGTNFVQVVPLKQIATLSLRAPVRDPSEPLLKPDELPNIGYGNVLNPAPRVPGTPKGASPKNSANDVIAYYAELTGRLSTPSKEWGPMPVVFRAQTPLTKAEFLYALETVLKLNGMSIVELDDKTISLRH